MMDRYYNKRKNAAVFIMKKIVSLILVMFTCLCFVACAPSNIEKAKEKLKDAGYTIVSAVEEEVPGVEGSVGMITAAKEADTLLGNFTGDADMVVAVLFESSKAAKEYFNENKEEMEEEGTAKLSGKWIIVGTEDGIKAFTK